MMNAMLEANPVNIHTHGLIVEPRKAGPTDHSYGDYVYVLGYPGPESCRRWYPRMRPRPISRFNMTFTSRRITLRASSGSIPTSTV